jgi:hypothetical protein
MTTHLSDSALLTRLVHGHKHGMNTGAMITGAIGDGYLSTDRGEALRGKLAARLRDEQEPDQQEMDRRALDALRGA